MEHLLSFETALKQKGYSVTGTRKLVFEAMQHKEPITMRELVALCPKTDRASVYRTVALYEQLGIVQRLQTGWKYKLELTDTFNEHHHHATCLTCGRSFVLPEDATVEKHLRRLAESVGLTLERHQLELQGNCESCQKLLEN